MKFRVWPGYPAKYRHLDVRPLPKMDEPDPVSWITWPEAVGCVLIGLIIGAVFLYAATN